MSIDSLSQAEIETLRTESPVIYTKLLEAKLSILEAEKKHTDSLSEALATVNENRLKNSSHQIELLQKQVEVLSNDSNELSAQNDKLRRLVGELQSLSEALLTRVNDLESQHGIVSSEDSLVPPINALENITTQIESAKEVPNSDPHVLDLELSSEGNNATHSNTGFGTALNNMFSKLFHGKKSAEGDKSSTPSSPLPVESPLPTSADQVDETKKVSSALVSFYSRILSNPGAVDDYIAASERASLLAELQDLETDIEARKNTSQSNDDQAESSDVEDSENDSENLVENDRFLVDRQLAELIALFDTESLGIQLPKEVISRTGRAMQSSDAKSEDPYTDILDPMRRPGATSDQEAPQPESTAVPTVAPFPSIGTPKLAPSNLLDISIVRAPTHGDIPNLSLTSHRGRSREPVAMASSTTAKPASRSSSRSRSQSRRRALGLKIINNSSTPYENSIDFQYPQHDKDAEQIELAYKQKAEILMNGQDADLERRISEKLHNIKSLIHDKQLEKDQEHIVSYFEKIFQQHVDEKFRPKTQKILDNQKKIVFGETTQTIDDSYLNALATSNTCTTSTKTAPIKVNLVNSIQDDTKAAKPKRVFYAVTPEDNHLISESATEVKCKTPIRESFFTDLKARGFTSNPDLRTPDGKPWPRAPFEMKGEYLTADDVIDNLRAQRQLEEAYGLRSNMIDKFVLMGMDKKYEYLVRREFDNAELKDTSMTSFDRAAQFVADKLFGYK